MSKIIKAGRIDDAIGSEISYVDHPSNGESKIVGVTIAKRDDESVDLNPDALAAIGIKADEAGPLKKILSWLFAKKGKLGGFLVTDQDGKGHLPTERDGKRDHRLMGAAWAALHGGYRGNKYEGPDKDGAIARLKRMYEEEAMELPSDKSSKGGNLKKSLYDVGDMAHVVMCLDSLAHFSASERDWEGDQSDLPERLTALRDEAGKILIAMVAEEVSELRAPGSVETEEVVVDVEAVAKSILDKVNEQRELEKKGAKISAANQECINKAMGCMDNAEKCFGKAAASHPDDENITNGMAHHAMAKQHLAKLSGGASDADADDSSKVAKVVQPVDAEAIQTEIAKQVESATSKIKGEFDKQLEEIEKRHKLELENAKLAAQLEAEQKKNTELGNLPARPKAHIGIPVDKGAHAAEIARAAGGGETTPNLSDIKPGDPDAFRKSMTVVRSNPQSLRTLKADIATTA